MILNMGRARTRFGNVTLGTASRIVGVISHGDTLQRLAVGGERECDIIELRLDLVGADTPRWLENAQAIEARGLPVICTVRLTEEGGQWKQSDEARLPLFEKALSHLAAADIELRSPLVERVSALARQHQRALIVSHHDFEKTPPLNELKEIMNRAAKYGTVVKVATAANNEQDIGTLRSLLHEECPVPLCLIGMGPVGAQTRVEFPKLGSCLTYGYLDTPVASGQISARELTQLLRRK
jgi:3-dehydroquinate dehydratase-1